MFSTSTIDLGELLFAKAQNPIAVLDRNYRFVRVNEAVLRTTGQGLDLLVL